MAPFAEPGESGNREFRMAPGDTDNPDLRFAQEAGHARLRIGQAASPDPGASAV